jgi:hypothetical protein
VTAHPNAEWIARQLTEPCGWKDPFADECQDNVIAGLRQIGAWNIPRRRLALGQPPHRGRCVELLGDRDEGHLMAIEQFDEFGEVRQRAGQRTY